MIDGAHVLTPGRAALRHGRPAGSTSRPSSPPSSGTSGPASSPTSWPTATTRTFEDQLFDADRVAGQRLPAVRDRPLHRRPRLVRRRLGEQLPVRAPRRCSSSAAASTRASRWPAAATPTSSSTSASASTPGVTEATILGEGSFHQVHGGTTTNLADVDERRERIGVLRASTSTSSAGAASAAPTSDRTTSAPCSPRPCAAKSRRKTAAEFFRKGDPERPRRPPAERRADPRGPRARLPRGLLAQPRLEEDLVARAPGGPLPRRPGHLPGDHQRGAARLDHRHPHRRRRPGHVPGVDLRPGRATARCCRSTTASSQDLPEHPRITYLTAPTSGDETAAAGPRDHRRRRARPRGARHGVRQAPAW